MGFERFREHEEWISKSVLLLPHMVQWITSSYHSDNVLTSIIMDFIFALASSQLAFG